MTSYGDPTDFAWVITKDHLYNSDNPVTSDEAGTIGPSESPDELSDMLGENGHIDPRLVRTFKFRMYDDDGILYYTGKLITKSDDPSEEALYAPLADFGGPNSGAVLIKYKGHPDWTMEY